MKAPPSPSHRTLKSETVLKERRTVLFPGPLPLGPTASQRTSSLTQWIPVGRVARQRLNLRGRERGRDGRGWTD